MATRPRWRNERLIKLKDRAFARDHALTAALAEADKDRVEQRVLNVCVTSALGTPK